MIAKQIGGSRGERRFALVGDEGDEVVASLRELGGAEHVTGFFTGLGGLREATIAFWNPETKVYEPRDLREQLEVAALTGSIALADDGPKVHAHIVVAGSDGRAYAGHLIRGVVRPTLELSFTESATVLRRVTDEATGLSLLRLSLATQGAGTEV
ncbi:MAG TPA: DUF296 domain-containing protein [Gemmatimonadaceae bacterium]|nr:DUF296 domain-containing protein [Gemmatimonadaceae bacterium]